MKAKSTAEYLWEFTSELGRLSKGETDYQTMIQVQEVIAKYALLIEGALLVSNKKS